jgi:beta-lactamase regulating signal transducer with metallopeptidase domain
MHWFNPLVWIVFMLMSRDMELSCDERVLKEMDKDIKKPYANSLLSLATGRYILNGSPLAFGEGNVSS